MSTTPNQNLGAYFAAMQLASTAYTAHLTKQSNKDIMGLKQTQIDLAAGVRTARNARSAEAATTARLFQSVNAQRQMDQAGRRKDAAMAVIGRLQDAGAANTAERRLRLSQDLGAIAAQSAFAGATETGAGAVGATLALREQRAQEVARRQTQEQSFLLEERATDAGGDVAASFDPRAIFASLDYNTPAKATSPYSPDMLTAVLMGNQNWGALARYAGDYFKPAAAPSGDPADRPTYLDPI